MRECLEPGFRSCLFLSGIQCQLLAEVSEHLVLGALVHPRHVETKLLAQELFDEICFADSSSAIDGDEFGLVGIEAILYQLNFPFSSNDILLHIFFNFDFLQR